MNKPILDPVDACGCGDEGYLTTWTIPIDLAHGVGRITNVPVYHCRNQSCPEYNLPQAVSRRLDELAEQMEEVNSLEQAFSWETDEEPSLDPLKQADQASALIQAFTLRLVNREFEDARVALVIPGQAVFLQSKSDQTEYYALQYLPGYTSPGNWFSFSKFYHEGSGLTALTADQFESFADDGLTKELAVLEMQEVDDTLSDHFGEIL